MLCFSHWVHRPSSLGPVCCSNLQHRRISRAALMEHLSPTPCKPPSSYFHSQSSCSQEAKQKSPNPFSLYISFIFPPAQQRADTGVSNGPDTNVFHGHLNVTGMEECCSSIGPQRSSAVGTRRHHVSLLEASINWQQHGHCASSWVVGERAPSKAVCTRERDVLALISLLQ